MPLPPDDDGVVADDTLYYVVFEVSLPYTKDEFGAMHDEFKAGLCRIHPCAHTHTHARTHARTHAYRHTYTRARTHTHTHTHTHIHTHTHTQQNKILDDPPSS